jgi:hypothetical protein
MTKVVSTVHSMKHPSAMCQAVFVEVESLLF